uniref:Magnesium transporter protein 1 n=1 Tax=Elaeophora elaphi TaxID=1147741 RepID=A0A0R3RZJ1_9BILA
MQLIILLAILRVTYSQKGVYLDEKVKNLQEIQKLLVRPLQEWMYRRPLINLNVDRWKTYVRSAPRNYSMVVMFTALSPNVNCAVCKSAYDEFYILANSYRYAYPELKALYFAIVDYDESPEIFQQMNLNVAPVLLHFPSKGAKKRTDQMDFERQGFDADSMAKFVFERTDIQIRVLRPPNYAAPAVVLLLAMLVLGLLYMRRNNLDFLYNRTSWALICLCVVFAFMSGQMWNHIHGPPFVMTRSHTRETSFIHGSTQYQLVAETYLVAVLYAAITAGFILMNDAADGKGDSGRRRIMAFVGLGLVVVFFSLLLSIFRSKYQGYPYSFLFH